MRNGLCDIGKRVIKLLRVVIVDAFVLRNKLPELILDQASAGHGLGGEDVEYFVEARVGIFWVYDTRNGIEGIQELRIDSVSVIA